MISYFTQHRDILEHPELAVKMEKLGKRSVRIFFAILPSETRIAGN